MGGDQPPLLTEGMDYLKWKREVGIWELGTSIAAAKQAAVCVLRIQDFKARDFATRLDVTELKKDEGLTYLMAELDKYFEEDNTQSIFLGIDDLEKFVRPEQMQMTEYIAEFKRRLNRIGELFDDKKDIYHDGMLAYRLLTQANLTKDQQILIKAAMGTEKLTSKTIEECLKRCFGDAVFCRRSRMDSDTVKIKVEPGSDVNYHRGQFDEKDTDIRGDNGEYTFYQGYNNRSQGGRKSFSCGSYNNYSNGRGKSGYYSRPWERNKQLNSKERNNSDYKDELNAISHKTGDVARCSICDSNKHFRADCQHNPKKKDSNSVCMYQSCRNGKESNKIDNDYCETVNETFNKVLIDTGTTSNVCGDVWLNTFLESMPEDLKKKVSKVKRNMSFRFGDGRAVESIKCVMLPIKLCNRDLMLETFVVPGELPFLLSRCCMKQLGVSLDFENDQIRIGGEPQQLKVTNSGHYVADIMLWENKESEKYTIEKTGSGESVKKEQIVVSDSESESDDGFCPEESGEESNEPSAEQVEVLDETEISIEESGSVETSGEQLNSESVVEENRDTSELDEFQKDSSSDEKQDWVDVAVKKNKVLDLKSEDVIRYKSAEHTNDVWQRASVIGPGWKQSSVAKNNINIWNLVKEPEGTTTHLRLSECQVQKKSPNSTEQIMFVEDKYETESSIDTVIIPKERYGQLDQV